MNTKMTGINSFNELTEKVLDKQDSLLSPKEVNQLNQIKPVDYSRMKEQIAKKEIKWKNQSYVLEDFVNKIELDGTVDGEKIKRWSELGAWVQIFLISQEYDTNKANQKYLGIDGKLGRFTWKSISAYKGDKRTLSEADRRSTEKVDQLKLNRINDWLQWAREFSDKWNNPIKVSILDKKKPFVIAVENYGMKTIVDLNSGKMTFDGVNFKWLTDIAFEKVAGDINIESTSKNKKLLPLIYKQASLFNRIFGQLVKVKQKSDSPFFHHMGGLNIDDGMLFDTDILEDIWKSFWSYSVHHNMAWGKRRSFDKDVGFVKKDDLVSTLNQIYQKRVKEGKIK